ncbi:MAG: nitronate monooxygenase, partial [Opitutaceae bacterium]
PNLETIRSLGLPFWLAGSYACPDKLREAAAAGATGVQIGTAFAFCEESGLREEVKREVIRKSRDGTLCLLTDPRASPTGLPFKVVDLEGTVSDAAIYQQRTRVCDLGYLRQAYERTDGSVGYRCPAEPEEAYAAKGGQMADTKGRKCLCNGLLAAIGLGQATDLTHREPPIVTAGEDVAFLERFFRPGENSYRAADVLSFMLEVSREAFASNLLTQGVLGGAG